MKIFRRRLRRENGAVAVEFALIMPVLLLILFGTIEWGRVWSQHQVFNGAAREGARCAAVQGGGFATCDIEAEIQNAAGPYEPDLSSLSVSNDCSDPEAQGEDVTVAWIQPLDINIPFWDSVTVNPTIEATFRCE
jgi:Flp pilus assembly protein TadG